MEILSSRKKLIVNSNSAETRIALLENDRVAELFIERSRGRGIVGNIYLGRVSRVLPGMQAAFVDIGIERTAFLYSGDVLDPENIGASPTMESNVDPKSEDLPDKRTPGRPIEKLLKDGQTIVVQVAKEPLGSKGARVTMYLSLPGRFLVLMPDFSHTGISRRITCEAERQRLFDEVERIKQSGSGIIVRTAAEGLSSENLQKDLNYLTKLWSLVDSKRTRSTPPALLYKDLDLVLKTTRDIYSSNVEAIVVDDHTVYEDLHKFLDATIPGAAETLSYYEDATPIFDVYGIEMDIGRALHSKIELPSGGYLIIDQTEALTSFDINTGRFVGKVSAQDTILRTNLEAIDKIVAQLRIRNIGGIIVIDFIDMERPADREKVYSTLQEELKHDKAKTNVLRISELGLVQMTRKRTSDSLERQLTESCVYCDGRGRIRSTETEAYDLMREIVRFGLQTREPIIAVRVRDDIREWIEHREGELFQSLLAKHNLTVEFQSNSLNLKALQEPPYEVISQ